MEGSIRPVPNPRASRRVAGWTLLWAVLAVIHVTQAVWLSGGGAWPGDLADGRFNQLVLEHGHQSLRGRAEWASPGQFFPVRGTLSYSDTHAGTLPIYTALRTLSISREEAWQLWFVLVMALNVWAGLRLMRALGIDERLCGPLVFAAAGSATMVWFAGTHAQMLPIFPTLFAWEQAVRWVGDRVRWRGLTVTGWLGWQLAAGPYSFFFALTITAVVALFFLLLGRSSKASQSPSVTGRRTDWVRATLILLAGGGLAVAVLGIHVAGIRAGHSRPLSEVIDLAPRPASWFTAAPIRWLPSGISGEAPINLSEHAWFAGWLPWLLLAAALATGWRQRRTPGGRWMLVLVLATLTTGLFFTQWSAIGSGGWIWLVSQFEPLGAFRASGRIAGLLQFVMVGAGGLFLSHWLTAARTRAARMAMVGVASAMAVEQVCHHQPSTPVATARARTRAVVEAWRQAGDRPVLAYAPGYSNQPESWAHLDAWSAALQLGRVTINGYSGGLPGSHVEFALNPNGANARKLVEAAGIPRGDVSFVEAIDAMAAAGIGLELSAGRPMQALAGFDLQPVGWNLFAPLETFRIEGRTMYQFTPPAEVRFAVPDSVRRVTLVVGMRPGSYDGSGNSDGIGLTWLMLTATGPEIMVQQEILNPRDRPADRGLLERSFALPPGRDRMLVLRIDPGPRGDTAWDWPVFGALRTD